MAKYSVFTRVTLIHFLMPNYFLLFTQYLKKLTPFNKTACIMQSIGSEQ